MTQATTRGVQVEAGGVRLDGDLDVPDGAHGLVLFAHGSGSGRYSPRNRFVAGRIQAAGVGTLLFDLLTASEEEADRMDGHLRFDIPFLGDRLLAVTDWVTTQPSLRAMQLGYFGSSTGGAAALVAASRAPDDIATVVSRGGRPDLAAEALPNVRCPVLLIVGGDDAAVLQLNEQAQARMTCPTTLRTVAGAGHLFEEPGALEQVAALATDWFAQRLQERAKGPGDQ